MRRKAPSGPSSSRRPPRWVFAVLALVSAGCASAALPAPEVAERAAAAAIYSASLRVSVSGPEVWGRSRVLLAFRRPDAVRIEIPGPSGARLIAVVRAKRLVAVLPGERAVLESDAGRADLAALLGVSLEPGELMDFLVGVASPRMSRYEARWGKTLPRRVEARLADGTRLRATIDEAATGLDLPQAAFDPPPHPGYRPVDAAEARRLLGGR